MYAAKPRLHERQRRHRPGQLRTLALDVTPRCNMACPHCYAETFRSVEPVPLPVLARALDEAYELGVFHYVLQGGEPIEDPERLEGVLGLCHPDESYLNVVSNGWAMDRATIEWLRGLQVDKIAFSLDSGIAAEHDANRRPGSFDRTLRAIDDVLACGLLASVSIVVTRQSLYSQGFSAAYELCLDRGIRIDVQIAEPVGKWDGRTDLLLRPEDSAFVKQLQLASPVLPNGQRMVNRDIFSSDRDHCPAGVEFMGLTADGNVLPCNFLQLTLGNIRERSLGEMREELIASRWFDGSSPRCLCGEEAEFIDAFIVPFRDRPKPLSAHEVLGLQRRGPGEE